MSDEKKITKAVDKLVMGLIIGGAVGSVLGMAFSPKSGKENRDVVAKKGLFSLIKKTLHSKKKKIPHE